MNNFTEYELEAHGCALDYDEYFKFCCKGKDLTDLFPDDELLADEDMGYDNYLHAYYEVNDGEVNVIGVGYENCAYNDDVMLDITDDEKAYIGEFIKQYLNEHESIKE